MIETSQMKNIIQFAAGPVGMLGSKLLQENKKEPFDNSAGASLAALFVIDIISALIGFIIFFYAMYLCFKCNKGFKFGSFLAAFCCPLIYVIYILAATECHKL